MVENSLGIGTFQRIVVDGPQPRGRVVFQFVEDVGGVGAELRRWPRDATRCPREPGRYAWEAHRSVRGVHGLEHADGVEVRIVEQRAGCIERRGRYLEFAKQRQPLARRALFYRLGQQAIDSVDLPRTL